MCVIGCGSWGTTIALLLARKNISVVLTGRDSRRLEQMQKERENKKYLAGFMLPPEIYVQPDMNEAIQNSESIIAAVPSHAMQDAAGKIKPLYGGQPVLIAAKGMNEQTMETNSQTVKKIMPRAGVGVLSGPNLSREMACGKPAASVAASKQKHIALYFQRLLSSGTWRIYTHHDVRGVELGGALKNIYAIGCGINDGLELGANSRAAFLTRGLAEMTRLGYALGAKEKTFYGLSGAGDMMATCVSPLSRNYTTGVHLASGKKLSQIIGHDVTVAEGVPAAKAAHHLAVKKGVDAPIVHAMYGILFRRTPVKTAVTGLMQRTLKHEER